MKIFTTVVPNGDGTYIDCTGCASNAREFTEIYGGGITKPRDVTSEYFVSPNENPSDNSCTRLVDTLVRSGWGSTEAQFLSDLLEKEFERQGR